MAFVVGCASLTASPSLGMPLAVCLRQRARGCALVIRCRSFLGPCGSPCSPPMPSPLARALRLALLAARALALGSGFAARLATGPRSPVPGPWPLAPAPGPSFYFSPKYGAGFTLLPFIITSKCRCGPVAYPVMPILAIC